MTHLSSGPKTLYRRTGELIRKVIRYRFLDPEASAEVIAEGKAIFEGKGTCVNCHGKKGDGNGPAGKVLNPGPRDFTNCKFHKKRKEGVLMWVIKNGSPGTGMVPLIPATINEEEAWKVIAYERSFCEKFKK